MDAAEIIIDNIPLPSPKAPKNTPWETILKLKEHHPTISAKNLGKLVGISPQAVHQMFIRHGVDFHTGQVFAVEEYKVNRADILAVKQIEALNHIDGRRLKKASVRDLGLLYGVLYDKERLERGQSTENISVSVQSLIDRTKEAGLQVIQVQAGTLPPQLRQEYIPDDD